MHLLRLVVRGLARRELLLYLLMLSWNCSAWTQQQTAGEPQADAATIQLLIKRIDQLEARVKELEAERQPAIAAISGPTPLVNSGPSTDPVATAASSTPPAHPQAAAQIPTAPSAETESENAMADRMDMSKTLLRIRGFGDISLKGDTYPGDTTSFELGQLDLFITSDVAEKFKFLSEVVFEAGPDNIYGQTVGEENVFGVDVERYLMQYSPADYLNLSVGRFHTAIGY